MVVVLNHALDGFLPKYSGLDSAHTEDSLQGSIFYLFINAPSAVCLFFVLIGLHPSAAILPVRGYGDIAEGRGKAMAAAHGAGCHGPTAPGGAAGHDREIAARRIAALVRIARRSG